MLKNCKNSYLTIKTVYNRVVQKLTHEEINQQRRRAFKDPLAFRKAFVKEIQAEFKTEPPHYNTLSTLVRNLEDKGYVTHKAYGNTHQYAPLISKEDYRSRFINSTLDDYFSSSYKSLVTAFAQEEKIRVDELKEIITHIENQK